MSRNPLRRLVLAAIVTLLAASPAFADQHERATNGGSDGVLALLPADSVTEHTLDLGAETLTYTATAGTYTLFDRNGERSAAIFYVAYSLADAPAESRPVTFAFNGGPGASSAYLHLGLVGPRTVAFDAVRDAVDARLGNNPHSWLKFTDLVLIDPVGAGWSRAARPDKTQEFWSVRADAEALAKTVALHVARHRRTGSPKYLLGESYGGYRAVKVAGALQQDQGILLNGIVMVSPFLEGALLFGASRFALGAALRLPALAAAELDRQDRFTAQALAAAERFALTEYLTTLAGRPPEGEAAHNFYGRVAEITGVPFDVVARTRGFIGGDYTIHVGDDEAGIVSPYDAAAPAPDPFPESASDDAPDPVLDGYTRALGGLFVGYARQDLGFSTDMTYTLLNRETARRWDWGHGGRAQASVGRDLRELLALNTGLRVFVAHGRSDVVTPYPVSRYVLDHLPPIGPPGRTRLETYKGGHMFYFDDDARAAFASDVQAIYRPPE